MKKTIYIIPEECYDNGSDMFKDKVDVLSVDGKIIMIPFNGTEEECISFVRGKLNDDVLDYIDKNFHFEVTYK